PYPFPLTFLLGPSPTRGPGMGSRLCLPAGLLFLLLFLLPLGCGQPVHTPVPEGTPIVRVRILENLKQVTVAASEEPSIRFTSEPAPRRLRLSGGASTSIALQPTGTWQIGNQTLGSGEMHILPARDGTVSVNGTSYRGKYRLVPIGNGMFDVVNDVDIEGYLKSVLPKELLRLWHIETYKAQAIVARTYALYVARTTPPGRHYDLQDDQRSQVYGGIAAETSKSREAVDATRGIVVAFGPEGREKIFKTY